MSKQLKIVIIGGGSSYTPELIEGFIKRYNTLDIKEIYLVDIEAGQKKLDIIYALTKRMLKKGNLKTKVYKTLNRKEALKDADFIITQIRVGGLDARILDERIPLSHQVLGQETNGAGGMFKAFRTIPVMLDIVADIKKYAKKSAWLINFSNPAGIITEAIFQHTNFKNVIGLCNVPFNMKVQLSELLEVDYKDTTLEIIGLNHHFFVTNIYHRGTSLVDKLIDDYTSGKYHRSVTMKNIESSQWSTNLIKSLQAIPNPYLTYYFNQQEQLELALKQYQEHDVRAEAVKRLEQELFIEYADENLAVKPKHLEERGGAYYSDAACALIDSIVNNTRDIQYVITKNNGTLTNLAPENVIETAAIITSDGPKNLPIGEIPYQLNGTIQTIKSFELLTIEAIIKKDKALAISALILNPLVASEKKAEILFDELYQAHRKYLPNFK